MSVETRDGAALVRIEVRCGDEGAIAHVNAIPRVGDWLICGDERRRIRAQVESVMWPTFDLDDLGRFDGREPEVYVRRPESVSDEDWREVWFAMERGQR